MPPGLLKKLFQLTLFGLLLASCSPPGSAPVSTAEALTPTPTDVVASTALQALFVADNNNSAFSNAEVEISSPGTGSQVSSPILLEVGLRPGADELVRVELVDERGRLLARKILEVGKISDDKIEIEIPIYFEISPAALVARLTVSVEDEFERLRALNSVEIVLLSGGQSSLAQADLIENIIIEHPIEGETVEGGRLVITGEARSRPGRPLNVQLIGRNGRVLAFGEAYPVFDEGEEYGTFQLELDYSVDETVWALLAIGETRNETTIHYTSVEVVLAP